MLFDLRSRGRRRTVQVVYLGLAVILGGGLILFGVGTGSGTGGLLNAFTGSGSNNQSSALSQQEKTALKQVKADPNSATAWGNLAQARYENASSAGFSQSTNTYTAAGKKDLAGVGQAWQRYLALTKNPSSSLAVLAANAYGVLGQYADEANAWEIEAAAAPGEVKAFECLAISAYAAKQTRKGDLAAAKAISLVPKAQRKQLTTVINGAKTNPALAAQC
jgi:hypothetical protein